MQARSTRQMFAPARGDLARTIILGMELLRLEANTKRPAEGEGLAGLLDWPEQAGGIRLRWSPKGGGAALSLGGWIELVSV